MGKKSRKNSLEKKLFSNIKYNMNNNSPLDQGLPSNPKPKRVKKNLFRKFKLFIL